MWMGKNKINIEALLDKIIAAFPDHIKDIDTFDVIMDQAAFNETGITVELGTPETSTLQREGDANVPFREYNFKYDGYKFRIRVIGLILDMIIFFSNTRKDIIYHIVE